jgi:hypothetical protein
MMPELGPGALHHHSSHSIVNYRANDASRAGLTRPSGVASALARIALCKETVAHQSRRSDTGTILITDREQQPRGIFGSTCVSLWGSAGSVCSGAHSGGLSASHRGPDYYLLCRRSGSMRGEREVRPRMHAWERVE